MSDLFIEKIRILYDEENLLDSLAKIEDAVKIESLFSDITFDEIVEKLDIPEETVASYKVFKLL